MHIQTIQIFKLSKSINGKSIMRYDDFLDRILIFHNLWKIK